MSLSPRTRRLLVAVTITAVCAAGLPAASVAAPQSVGVAADAVDIGDSWIWPIAGLRRVVEPFRAPAHAYGAGHRGIDIAAPVGTTVRAPAAGVIAFRGTVVDRPVLTIAHSGGLVTTFEPLDSPREPGDAVAPGEEIGIVGSGGHTAPDALHVGVRLDGAYINPLLLFGEVPRAVLLPCCASP